MTGRAWLVLAIHHLVVDGASWRILLDELRQVADSAMQGQPITRRRRKPRSMNGPRVYGPTSNAAKPSCRSGGRCWRTACHVWGGARWNRRPIASPR
ncbi:condensation domain-containing protein [Serratia ureilytica]